jgi:hypothetical protein
LTKKQFEKIRTGLLIIAGLCLMCAIAMQAPPPSAAAASATSTATRTPTKTITPGGPTATVTATRTPGPTSTPGSTSTVTPTSTASPCVPSTATPTPTQIGSSYLARNGTFQMGCGVIPDAWKLVRLNLATDGRVCSAGGECSLKIKGNGTAKSVVQNTSVEGAAGDTFIFQASSSANNVPATGGLYRARAVILYADGTQQAFELVFDAGTHSFQSQNIEITAEKDYVGFKIRLNYTRSSGRVHFDDIQLYQVP